MSAKGQFVTFLFFSIMALSAVGQSEEVGLKTFRYDIAFQNSDFQGCSELEASIKKLEGVSDCQCLSESKRITIYSAENGSSQVADEDEFKWVFLDYDLNIIKQKRNILTIDGVPIENNSTKGAPAREGGSSKPQQSKSVKIQGKGYQKN